MDLSIIIVNWNTSKLLRQSLESIYRAESRLTFEIIVVDNGSTDDSVHVCNENFPPVQVISNDQNLGFAKANNQGLAVAEGRYLLLLNSDTMVLPGALDEMVRVADNHAEIGAMGPKLLNIDGTLQRSWASFPTLWSEFIGKNLRYRRFVADVPFAYEVDSVGGACLLVRAEAVKDAGKLDEDYFMYSEEIDWCFRIKKKGWKIWYLSSAEVYHLGGGSADHASLTQLMRLYAGKILFFRKNYGHSQAMVLRYALVLANSLGLIRRAIFTGGKDKKAVQQRLAVQAKLVLRLLRNQFPSISS